MSLKIYYLATDNLCNFIPKYHDAYLSQNLHTLQYFLKQKIQYNRSTIKMDIKDSSQQNKLLGSSQLNSNEYSKIAYSNENRFIELVKLLLVKEQQLNQYKSVLKQYEERLKMLQIYFIEIEKSVQDLKTSKDNLINQNKFLKRELLNAKQNYKNQLQQHKQKNILIKQQQLIIISLKQKQIPFQQPLSHKTIYTQTEPTKTQFDKLTIFSNGLENQNQSECFLTPKKDIKHFDYQDTPATLNDIQEDKKLKSNNLKISLNISDDAVQSDLSLIQFNQEIEKMNNEKLIQKLIPQRNKSVLFSERIFEGFKWSSQYVYIINVTNKQSNRNQNFIVWKNGIISLQNKTQVRLIKNKKSAISIPNVLLIGNSEVIVRENQIWVQIKNKYSDLNGNFQNGKWKVNQCQIYTYQ